MHVRIKEGEKERIQIFEGLVIKKKKSDRSGGSFTVRKVSYGIGVERVFPMHSPVIEKIELVDRGKVRRARLFYLREKKGKAAQVEKLKDEALKKEYLQPENDETESSKTAVQDSDSSSSDEIKKTSKSSSNTSDKDSNEDSSKMAASSQSS